MKTKMVALCGAKGSGKSTVAKLLEAELIAKRQKVQILSLADKLKNVCADVFEVDRSLFDDPELKEKELATFTFLDAAQINLILENFGIHDADYSRYVRPHVGVVLATPRYMAQYVGTEVLRSVCESIHTTTMLMDWDMNTYGIVQDLRFENEQEIISTCLAGDVIFVYVNNRTAEVAASEDKHSSEGGYHRFKHLCYHLDNNGTLGALTAKVADLALHL